MKPRIVVSGVNLVEGGPLSVFRDALLALRERWADRYEIVALVHRRELMGIEGVTYLEFPKVKSSWVRRMHFEYRACLQLSRRLRPQMWLAMHDMTPEVEAGIRAVYCHNPSPFYTASWQEMKEDWRFGLFTMLYTLVYRVHLKRNDFVIVQQQWLREEFKRRYGAKSVVVAHPSISRTVGLRKKTVARSGCRFIYPAYPRPFKNVETLLEAARLLEQRWGGEIEVWITIDGRENAYAKRLFATYGSVRSVRWLGRVPRERVLALYEDADCLVFASKLETWGMPVSEFKQTGKPMLVADLAYAHETVGTYDKARFFAANDAHALSLAMEAVARGTHVFEPVRAAAVAAPFAQDWHELFGILLGESSAFGDELERQLEMQEVGEA